MERVQRKPKSTSSSRSMTLARPQFSLFDEPLLLEGEDRAAYDELLARVREALKPVDIIDEMYIADAVQLEWEVLRWRRFKLVLMRANIPKALKNFLANNLEDHHYQAYFTDDLRKVLQGYSGHGHYSLQEGEEAYDLVDNYVQKCRVLLPRWRLFSNTQGRICTTLSKVRGRARQKSSCKNTCKTNKRPSSSSKGSWRVAV